MIAKEYQRQGLATEAAQAILHFGFEKLGLSRLICLMDPANLASQNAAQKIGMSLEREVDGIAGDNFPTFIYSIRKVKS